MRKNERVINRMTINDKKNASKFCFDILTALGEHFALWGGDNPLLFLLILPRKYVSEI